MRSVDAGDEARRHLGRALAASVLGFALLLPAIAEAQEWVTEPEKESRSEDRTWSLRGSFGMTGSPETFNMTLEAPWHADDLISAGPLVQLGFADDHFLFATTVQAYLTPRLDGQLADWHPYAHMGMGFIYLEDDDRRGNRDEEDADFLFTIGTGVDYGLSENFYMGTAFLFNTIPTGAVGNKFIFGWQILTFRHEF